MTGHSPLGVSSQPLDNAAKYCDLINRGRKKREPLKKATDVPECIILMYLNCRELLKITVKIGKC